MSVIDQLIATLARRPEFEQLQIMVVNDPQIVVRVASLLCQNSTALSQVVISRQSQATCKTYIIKTC